MASGLDSIYRKIDSLQMEENYEEIEQIAQYAIDAAKNDNYVLKLRFPKLKKVKK